MTHMQWVFAFFSLLSCCDSAYVVRRQESKGISLPAGIPENSPVGKVLQLLSELKGQLNEDAASDKAQFEKYTTWYTQEKKDAELKVQRLKEIIEFLESQLQLQVALREDQTLISNKAANELAKAQAEMAKASKERNDDKAAFEADETKTADAVQHLQHAIRVMGATPPAEDKPASLLDIAKKVRGVLLKGNDFALNLAQRETLDGFLHLAEQRSLGPAASLRGVVGDVLPDFLQVSESRNAGPFGEYESKSSGVVQTLNMVLEKTQQHLDFIRKKETDAKKAFKTKVEADEKFTGTLDEKMKTAKTQIAESQQRSGKMSAELLSTKELLKVSEESLAEMIAEFNKKEAGFNKRKQKRADEILAVTEASEVMTGPELTKVMQDHYKEQEKKAAGKVSAMINKTSDAAEADEPAPAVFFQVEQSSHGKLNDPSLLAVASQLEYDPFAKVTDLIRDMLARLQAEANADATKAQYCETEMSQSAVSDKRITANMDKLKGNFAELCTDIEQLGAEIKKISGELQTISEARNQATVLRQSEREQAEASIARYVDAQRLLRVALTALRRIYGTVDDDEESGYKVAGKGAGVVGLLEIAEDDFEQLESETKTSEKAAQLDYKKLMDSTDIKTKAFNKDLEYKSREKVKLETERMRTVEDLKSLSAELDALHKYMDELKAQCVKIETYEERKARREEEIQNLQNALEALGGPASS